MNDLYTPRTTCRACSGPLDKVFDLGQVHVNAFPLPTDPPVEKAPITVCQCRTCGHIQLGETVNRDRLFRNYWYRSSTQPAMVKDLEKAVEWGLQWV